MSDALERRAAGLAVVFFRHLAGRYQHELSDRTGVNQKRISRYELGEIQPERQTLERLARGTGVSFDRLDQLLVLFRAICAEIEAKRPGDPEVTDPSESERREDLRETAAGIAVEIAESLKSDIYEALVTFEADLAAGDPPLAPDEARDLAAELWRRLLPLSHRIRLEVLEYDEFRSWALCERICQESLQAATSDPAAARELAEEALSIAEQAPGGEAARHRLMAYALAHAAKVDTALGDLDEAAEKMQRARELWQAGDGSDGLDDALFDALASRPAGTTYPSE